VTIERDGETAIINFKDTEYGGIHLRVGAKIDSMSDADIVELHNQVVLSQLELAANWRPPTEIVPGRPQIKYDKQFREWSAEGHVLRCIVGSNPELDEPTVCIDSHKLSWVDFGRMVLHFEGWGMRILFVSEDQLSDPPTPELRKAPKRISKKELEEIARREAERT
jgi:hypothetical protein